MGMHIYPSRLLANQKWRTARNIAFAQTHIYIDIDMYVCVSASTDIMLCIVRMYTGACAWNENYGKYYFNDLRIPAILTYFTQT